ncbi:ATP-dependent metallopeptidase FtsH/Yme1/Tma family protein, partial [Microvirga tunisiensis]|uniref:ATP-dependent metallopeptidase FtsH/Yme1/Tma family protein n=1 Tax=Microvirga tunisiensis TaxID=2108360 RepID=UPI0030B902B0
SMFYFQSTARPQPDQLPYSAFVTAVEQGEIRSATIQGQEVIAERSAGGIVTTYVPQGAGLIAQLQQKDVVIKAEPPPQPSLLGSLLLSLLPFALMIGIVVWLSRNAMNKQGGGGLMSIGKSKAKLLTEAHGRVTFDEVAGIDEAKEDLQEVVEFLRDPQKFQRLGGRIPRG